MAHGVRSREGSATLSTTALVHEAYLKLFGSAGSDWQGRAHFFGAAARAMRQILVDAARHRLRRKRGGRDAWQVTLDEALQVAPVRADEIVALDEALERLTAIDVRQARIVEHRFFAGLTAEETAEAMGISVPTVQRDWRAARSWLWREMRA
jgi:RNA polymerase sigma factor (TIGR02999 family)